jgi:DNA-binding transcriptional regulator YhcF (GntR family)
MGASNRIASIVLSRSSPEPLYRQLADNLEAAIRAGGLKPGERLDSETILTKRFAVSRITLRQAVDELVRKQLLVRKQGKGTFVTAPAVKHDLRRLHGLLGSLFSQADAAGTRLLRYELALPPAGIAERLRLRRGQKAIAHGRAVVDRRLDGGGRHSHRLLAGRNPRRSGGSADWWSVARLRACAGPGVASHLGWRRWRDQGDQPDLVSVRQL